MPHTPGRSRLDRRVAACVRVRVQVEELVEALVERLCATQIPPLKVAADLMTPLECLVVTDEHSTIQQAAELLSRCPFTVLPVVRAHPPSFHRRSVGRAQPCEELA